MSIERLWKSSNAGDAAATDELNRRLRRRGVVVGTLARARTLHGYQVSPAVQFMVTMLAEYIKSETAKLFEDLCVAPELVDPEEPLSFHFALPS